MLSAHSPRRLEQAIGAPVWTPSFAVGADREALETVEDRPEHVAAGERGAGAGARPPSCRIPMLTRTRRNKWPILGSSLGQGLSDPGSWRHDVAEKDGTK